MKNSKILKTILFISGLVATSVGATILLEPLGFYAASGINLNSDVSMLNEVRASGGILLACGILIMTGAFITKLTFTATLISTLLYLSYGLSRLFSMVIDGIPVDALIQAFILELVIGLICVVAFIKFRVQEI